MKATYVYCVIAAEQVPRRPRLARGLPGWGPVRLLEVTEDLFVAVADAPLERYGEAAIRRTLSDLEEVSRVALAHEAIVASFASRSTVLPMKLFTIFRNDARAVEHVRAQRTRIAAIVKRVAHHEEWGVRVVRDPTAAAPRTSGSHRLSGAAYLMSKRTAHEEQGEALYRRLAACAGRAKRRSAGPRRLAGAAPVLDAAFLVPRARSARFQAEASREAHRLAPRGYRLTCTGPWPPYSFMHDGR